MGDFWGHFPGELLASICVALLSALVLFLYKLPSTLKELSDFMHESKAERKEHEERLNIHDELWSVEYQTHIDSRMIAKGERPFPIRLKKPQREH